MIRWILIKTVKTHFPIGKTAQYQFILFNFWNQAEIQSKVPNQLKQNYSKFKVSQNILLQEWQILKVSKELVQDLNQLKLFFKIDVQIVFSNQLSAYFQ